MKLYIRCNILGKLYLHLDLHLDLHKHITNFHKLLHLMNYFEHYIEHKCIYYNRWNPLNNCRIVQNEDY